MCLRALGFFIEVVFNQIAEYVLTVTPPTFYELPPLTNYLLAVMYFAA